MIFVVTVNQTFNKDRIIVVPTHMTFVVDWALNMKMVSDFVNGF